MQIAGHGTQALLAEIGTRPTNLQAVETVGDVVVAVRVKQTVDLLAEIRIPVFDALVPALLRRAPFHVCKHFACIQRQVPAGSAKHHAVLDDRVRALEVVHDTAGVRDARVSGHWQQPRERWERLPHDCAREPAHAQARAVSRARRIVSPGRALRPVAAKVNLGGGRCRCARALQRLHLLGVHMTLSAPRSHHRAPMQVRPHCPLACAELLS